MTASSDQSNAATPDLFRGRGRAVRTAYFRGNSFEQHEAVKALVEKHRGFIPSDKFLRHIPDLRNQIDENNELSSQEFKFPQLKGIKHCVPESVSELLWSAYFLTPGADVDSRDAAFGKTPLELAAESGYDKVVRLLLRERGVAVNTQDPVSGKTPLYMAAENGHEEIVDLLLVVGEVDMTLTDEEGMTALYLARENGHDSIVEKLTEREQYSC